MCGDKCRAKQAAENKRQFDERAKDSAHEKLYGNTYDYWYNRIRKLKKKNAPEVVITEAETAFSIFRSEAVRLKSELKIAKFRKWIYVQMDIIDRVMNKING